MAARARVDLPTPASPTSSTSRLWWAAWSRAPTSRGRSASRPTIGSVAGSAGESPSTSATSTGWRWPRSSSSAGRPTSAASRAARRVLADRRIWSGSAACWIRAAVCTAGPVTRRSPDQATGRDLAGVQPDAQVQGQVAEGGLGRLDDVAHGQGRPHPPGGVVVVPGGEAEHGEDGVADVLLQGPAEAPDLGGQPPEGLVQQVAGGLRVERLDQPGRVDQVGEEHGHDPPLLDPAEEPLPAGGAEARRSRRLDPAGGAGRAGRNGSVWGHGPHLGCGAGGAGGIRSRCCPRRRRPGRCRRLRHVPSGDRRPCRLASSLLPAGAVGPSALVRLHGAHGPLPVRDGGGRSRSVYGEASRLTTSRPSRTIAASEPVAELRRQAVLVPDVPRQESETVPEG